MRKFLLLALCLLGTASLANATEATLDFTDWKFSGANDWTSSYAEHEVKFDAATVTFASANKQSGTITDCPVTKGGNVTVVLNSDGDVLTAVTFNLVQWGSKKQTATLETSTDGTTFTQTNVTSSNFTLSSASLDAGVVAVRVSFSSQSNQVGIKSIDITYAAVNNDKGLADLKFSESQVNVVLGSEFTAPTLTKATTAEVTYSTDDPAVAEVDATTGEVTIKGAGTATITAKAEENDEFNAGSASYTIVVEKRIATIAELLELYGDTAKGQESESFIVGLEPVVIYNANGYVYIYDGEDYALIYAYNQPVEAGDKIAAGWTATLKNYNSLFEIIPVGTLEADGSADVPAPVKITDLATQLVAENQCMYIALDNVEFDAATTDETASGSARGYTGTVDGTTVDFFNNFKTASVEAGKYNVIGFISVFNTTVQVAPISFEKVTTDIESVELDSNAPAEYYNLQGVRVSGDEPGLYIVRQGDKVAKVLVK